MKKVLFFATFKEAQRTLEAFAAVQERGHPSRFRFDQGYIICTGMGLKNAFLAAMNAPKDDASWINVGVVGSLDGNCSIGQFVDVGLVGLLRYSEATKKKPPRGMPILLHDNSQTALFSSKTPVYYPINTGLQASFVDMEGYAIAYAAKLQQVPLRIVKVVSDICSTNSSTTIAQNLSLFSQKMAQYCEGFV